MIILRCCVIDDEPLARDLIASYVDKTPFMELVGKFSSAQEAIKVILEEEMDVVFLDIHMPPTCRIVFTTAYDRYAVDGYKVNALDYLMKPISYEEFVGAANRALEWADMCRRAEDNSRDNRYLIVRSEYKQIQIPVQDIVFIEGLKDYVKIYVEGETNSIMSLMSIKALENYLPSSEFMRVHRSYIVNKSKIRVIERNRIVFGKHYIPVSDSYKQAFTEWIGSHSLFPPSGIGN